VTYGPLTALTRYTCLINVGQSSITLVTCLTEPDTGDVTNYFQITQGFLHPSFIIYYASA
jgi:hypothetical protein